MLDSSSTRTVLLDAGRRALARSGYAGTRLADVVGDANLTTGAFYRHFASKRDFFASLFEEYRDRLESEVSRAGSLSAQIEVCLMVGREHTGVVLAAQELERAGSSEAEAARLMRERVSALIGQRLDETVGARDNRQAARMLYDIVSHYAFLESMGWIPDRDPVAVAQALTHMVEKGLYRT